MVRFSKKNLSINQNKTVPENFSDFIASNVVTLAHYSVARLDLIERPPRSSGPVRGRRGAF